MSLENVQVMKDAYAAFAGGDVPAVLAAMDPQIEWNEAENFPYADGNPYIGPDAIVNGVFARLVGEWEYWNLDVREILDSGETVVAMGYYDAKNKATGVEIHAQFAHIWRLENGKITRFDQYADTDQVVRAVAGS